MTKLKIVMTTLSLFCIVLFLTGSGCSKTEKKQTDNTSTKQEKPKTEEAKLVENGKYVCPMHPTLQTNEPAKCPVCKMNLVTKDELNKEMSEGHEKLEDKYSGKPNLIHYEVNLSVVKSTDCQDIIEKALKSDAGVIDYHTDILNKVVHMYFDKSKTSKNNIEKLISDAGFDANNIKANPEAVNKLPKECK